MAAGRSSARNRQLEFGGSYRHSCRLGARLRCRLVHQLDVAPLDVLAAQPVWLSRPARRAGGGDQRFDRRRLARSHPQQAVGLLALDPFIVGAAVQPEHCGNLFVGCMVEHPGLPAERGGRIAHGGDCVPAVVVAVAEGAHAVLPRLAPVDRGDPDDDAIGHWLRRRNEARKALERVIAAHVVIDPAIETRQGGGDEIALGWMQVPARGVAAQRPRAAAIRLPRRDRERELEQNGDRVELEPRGCRQPAGAHVCVAGRQPVGSKRQGDARRAFVGSERIGLVRPIEVTGPGRIALEMVLAALVVFEDRAVLIHHR